MFGLWKVRRRRKAAGIAIIPFVEQTRQRLGGIPDSAWREPYLLGFLCMLITLVARRDAGALHAIALASVQAGAWSDITGLDGNLVGEEICYLSAADDRTFDLGCRNAESFFEALEAINRRFGQGLVETITPSAISDCVGDDTGSALWARYFDAYVGAGEVVPDA